MALGFPTSWPTATPSATSVPTLTQLQNLLIPPQMQDGAMIWCQANQSVYQYQSQSGAAPDGVTILTTRNGGNSRWIFLSAGGAPALNTWTTMTSTSHPVTLASRTSYFVDTTGGAFSVNVPSTGLVVGSSYFEVKDAVLNFGNSAQNLTLNAASAILEDPNGGGFVASVTLSSPGQDELWRWNGAAWNLTF